MGYGDVFVAGVLGGVLAAEGTQAVAGRRCSCSSSPSLWDLLFLLDSINTLPATVPIAVALIARRGQRTVAHPPPPWHLFGELIIVPALVRPRALGGVMLANYTSGTLRLPRADRVLARDRARHGRQPHLRRRSPSRCSGGREIWGLPKELAEFELHADALHRAPGRPDAAGRDASAAAPGGVPLLIPAPIVSDAGATLGRARIKAAPALVTLDVPPDSPFASPGPERHPPRRSRATTWR